MSVASISECCFLSIPKDGKRLVWEVTQYCPYECEYCFTWSSRRREKFEANIQSVMPKIQELIQRIGVTDVLLTGGEPLSVSKEITPLLGFFDSEGIPFSISTTLYSEERFKDLCRFHPKTVNLSMDPPVAEKTRSAFKADFNRIERQLKIVEGTGIKAKLTAVISRYNYQNVPALLNFLTEITEKCGIIEKVAFNREYPIGFAADADPQTKAELKAPFNAISNWAKDIPMNVTLVNWSEFHAPLQSCPAGKYIVSVQQNADVTPCSLLYNITRSFLAGNLLRDSVDVIADRLAIFTRDLSKYYDQTKENTRACKHCKYITECGGGCLAMLPIASNHIPKRTCELSPGRIKDHERLLISDFHRKYHEVYSPEPQAFVSPLEQLDPEVEKDIKNYVRRRLVPSDLAHTIEHVNSVVGLTKLISKEEGASLRITVPAAYFHDAAPREAAMHHLHTFKSAVLAGQYLQKIGQFTTKEIVHIQYCIITSSYGSYLLGYRPLSLEAKVVRDADWLDAIGARGIARVFAFGQAYGAKNMGYPDFDPEQLPIAIDMNITGPDDSPIYHFHTKLLKILDLLQTATGRKLGEERHQFMVQFLKRYKEETSLGINNQKQLPLKFSRPLSSQDNSNT